MIQTDPTAARCGDRKHSHPRRTIITGQSSDARGLSTTKPGAGELRKPPGHHRELGSQTAASYCRGGPVRERDCPWGQACRSVECRGPGTKKGPDSECQHRGGSPPAPEARCSMCLSSGGTEDNGSVEMIQTGTQRRTWKESNRTQYLRAGTQSQACN